VGVERPGELASGEVDLIGQRAERPRLSQAGTQHGGNDVASDHTVFEDRGAAMLLVVGHGFRGVG
jgi:hypothetical protein